jgi:hypothetical protein
VGAAVSTRAHSDEKPDQPPDEKRNEKSDAKWYEQDPVYQSLMWWTAPAPSNEVP